MVLHDSRSESSCGNVMIPSAELSSEAGSTVIIHRVISVAMSAFTRNMYFSDYVLKKKPIILLVSEKLFPPEVPAKSHC